MPDVELEKLLIQLETDIIVAQKDGDFAVIEGLLWDEFREIDSRGGISTEPEVLRAVRIARLHDFSVEDFCVSAVNDACAIVTYFATTKRLVGGKERTSRARRSSIWARRQGSWKLIFHQGTPATSS